MIGAKPNDSSSISSTLGLAMKAMASASICCCPPLRSAAAAAIRSASTGKIVSTSLVAVAASSSGRDQPARRRFSATVSEPNTPCPPGIWLMPIAAISLGGA